MTNYSVQPYIEALQESVDLQNNVLMPGSSYVLKGKMEQGQPRFDLYQEATHIFTLNSFLAPLNCYDKGAHRDKITKLESSPISRKLAIRITENIGLTTDHLNEIFHGDDTTATTSKVHITYFNSKDLLFRNEAALLIFFNEYPNLEVIDCRENWATYMNLLESHDHITSINSPSFIIVLQNSSNPNFKRIYPKITSIVEIEDDDVNIAKHCPNLLSIEKSITFSQALKIGVLCPKIEHCSIEFDQSVDLEFSIAALSRIFSNLKSLELIPDFDTSFFSALLKSNKNLEFLNLSYYISPSMINDIVQNCKNLKGINLKTTEAKDNEVISLVTRLPKLEMISLGSQEVEDDRNITDASIEAIGRNCLDLRFLELFCCNLITDKSVITVAKNCKKLEEIILDCSFTENHITDESIFALAWHCHFLKKIALSGEHFTIASILALVNHVPHIESIDCENCSSISFLEIDPLRKQYPWIAFSSPPAQLD